MFEFNFSNECSHSHSIILTVCSSLAERKTTTWYKSYYSQLTRIELGSFSLGSLLCIYCYNIINLLLINQSMKANQSSIQSTIKLNVFSLNWLSEWLIDCLIDLINAANSEGELWWRNESKFELTAIQIYEFISRMSERITHQS